MRRFLALDVSFFSTFVLFYQRKMRNVFERIEGVKSSGRVSSVLNNDVKQFGKKFLVDGNEETCWNSDQAPNGSGQWILLDFKQAILPQELHLTFQGGFVGKTCKLEAVYDEQQTDTFLSVMKFYPNDDNSQQIFQIAGMEKKVKRLKIVFSESTDFYGRITVYSLDIMGNT